MPPLVDARPPHVQGQPGRGTVQQQQQKDAQVSADARRAPRDERAEASSDQQGPGRGERGVPGRKASEGLGQRGRLEDELGAEGTAWLDDGQVVRVVGPKGTVVDHGVKAGSSLAKHTFAEKRHTNDGGDGEEGSGERPRGGRKAGRDGQVGGKGSGSVVVCRPVSLLLRLSVGLYKSSFHILVAECGWNGRREGSGTATTSASL
mmetsp:Transcript_12649/g.39979  ORF Transcript_12649/g.39979 Transcript_12649/m.39979 type:complete len:205 (+) Transcript_12649:1095-1709(+)